jgi:protease-4
MLGYFYSTTTKDDSADWSLADSKSFCNMSGTIATIHVVGELVTSPSLREEETYTSADQILLSLKKASEDQSIKGIVMVVDSYGGSPVAAEEISKLLRSIQKPTVALIRDQGLSAGYWVAAGARHVVASSLSDVGSIGVTASYIENSKQNEKEGLTYVSLSSGKFKDAGSPDKPLTKEEEALFLRDIEKMSDIFVSEVSSLRSLPLEKVKDIADGSSMLGDRALSLGLIDEVGGWQEALQWLSEKTNAQVTLCDDPLYYGSYE